MWLRRMLASLRSHHIYLTVAGAGMGTWGHGVQQLLNEVSTRHAVSAALRWQAIGGQGPGVGS